MQSFSFIAGVMFAAHDWKEKIMDKWYGSPIDCNWFFGM